MWDGQAQIFQSIEHGDSALGIEVGSHQMLGLVEQPDARVFLHRGVHACLGSHLDVVLTIYLAVLFD